MEYKDINTPQELMSYLDKNFKYGVTDKYGKTFTNSDSDEFQKACDKWILKPVNEILKSGVGHCYDQTEIERDWFVSHGFLVKTFWVVAYNNEFKNCGFSHAYLAFFDKNKWFYFEHSDFSNKGIYQFDSLDELVNFQAQNQSNFAFSRLMPKNKLYTVLVTNFDKPKEYISMDEYTDFVASSPVVIEKDFAYTKANNKK